MTDTDAPDPVVSVRSSVVVHASPLPSPLPARPRNRFAVAVVAAVALGIALRLLAFIADRSLWIDEAMLALNVVERPALKLLEPLDHNQGAPVGFLLLTKLAVSLLGPTEPAFRLVPFLGSVGGLLAFTSAAFRLLPGAAAALAVGLFAVSPNVVGYAAEGKQYSTDAAIAAGLLAVALPLGTTERRRPLAVAGAVAVWFSHPAVFVLGGIGVALVGRALMRDRRTIVAVCGMIAAWLVSFAAVYVLNVQHLGGNQYLADFWDEAFLPLAPRVWRWLADKGLGLANLSGWFDGPYSGAAGPALVLAVAGGVALWREQQRAELAALLGVFGFALLASAVHKYPFGGRLLLFLVPLVVLLTARGVWAGVELLSRRWKPLAVTLVAVVVAFPLFEGVKQFRTPPRREELKPVLEHLRGQWQAGDRLYVYSGEGDAGAGPAFRFYTRGGAFPADRVILGRVCRDDPAAYKKDVAAIPRPGRVWVLFSHRHKDEEAVIRGHFDAVGERGDEFHADGAAVYEYRLR